MAAASPRYSRVAKPPATGDWLQSVFLTETTFPEAIFQRLTDGTECRCEIRDNHDHNAKSVRNQDRLRMPTVTQLAVFYATASKILRRKVIPDDDAQLRTFRAPRGESMLLMPLALPHDDAACRLAIAATTGVTPPSGRCCIVHDSGDIIEVCNADPTLDSHPLGKIIASESAGVGDRYIGGVFLRRYARLTRSTNTVLSTAWSPIVDLPPVRSEKVFPTATAH